MTSLTLLIKEKSKQIRKTKDLSLKRQYSLELGELERQLTLIITSRSTTPITSSTISDRVKVLDTLYQNPEQIPIQ